MEILILPIVLPLILFFAVKSTSSTQKAAGITSFACLLAAISQYFIWCTWLKECVDWGGLAVIVFSALFFIQAILYFTLFALKKESAPLTDGTIKSVPGSTNTGNTAPPTEGIHDISFVSIVSVLPLFFVSGTVIMPIISKFGFMSLYKNSWIIGLLSICIFNLFFFTYEYFVTKNNPATKVSRRPLKVFAIATIGIALLIMLIPD